jgi:capsular exopolysaccharide synthesis family protein
MSKIFEALNRAQQDDPGFSQPVPIESDAAPSKAVVQPAITLPSQPQPAVITETAAVRALPVRPGPNTPLLPFDGVHPRAGEQYRIIRTKLLQHPKQPRLCLVTSPGPGDGKTITSINLAGALALRTDAKVVLVDTDMRRPSVAELLGFPQSPGLADVLAGTSTLEEVLVQVEQLTNLYVIPAGKPKVNPSELLDSDRWTDLCAALRAQFRFIILDVLPAVGVADYELIQAKVDGVVLVVRPDHTNRVVCFRALEAIPKDKLLGVTVNCATDWFLSKTQGYGAYDYYYSSPDTAALG